MSSRNMTKSSNTWQSLPRKAPNRGQISARDGNSDAEDRHRPDIGLPLSDVSVYESISITEVHPGAAPETELDGPLDLLSEDESLEASEIAVGVILRYEQAWRMRGLATGRLLHSLCLAPGEVTQIAMSGWQRGSRGSATESVSEQEASDQAATRRRHTQDVAHSVASELQQGGSSATSLANQSDAGVGGVIGFLGASGGMSTNSSVATGVNWSMGSRNAAGDSLQRINEHTSQHAANVRARSATLVQEVGSTETEQFRTRVVANYNHMHALNMQYYEVLQVYELSARPVDAERCVFLPMDVVTFSDLDVSDFAVPLERAARAMGLPKLATAVARFPMEHQAKQRDVALKGQQVETAQARLNDAIEVMREAETELESVNRGIEVDTVQLERFDVLLEQVEREFIEFAEQGEATEDEIRARRREADETRLGVLQEIEDFQRNRDRLGRERDLLQRRLAAREREIAGLRERREEAVREHDHALAAERAQVNAITSELNERKLAFNQALWLQLEPEQITAMVRGAAVGRERLADGMDPTPIAIVGNYLGFRWGFANDEQGIEEARIFSERYLAPHREDVLSTTALPTGGVFAEAVLGRANAAEKLDLSRYWRWDDDSIPILPTAIEALQSARRPQRAEATPGTLGASSVALQDLPAAPAGPAHALTQVVGASLFRDMSGSGVIGELLKASQQVAGENAEEAQEMAHQNISAFLDHVEELLPQVTEAIGKGEIDPSTLGALGNLFGDQAAADPSALLGMAAETGLLL